MTVDSSTKVRDEKFMAAALSLAKQGEGRTRPNPLVGCVITHNDTVVATGYHQRAGEDHAEVVALKTFPRDVTSPQLNECTLYVNLEPCSHYGRTGPCANAIIDAGIKRVVIGTIDPNPRVSGKGIALLRQAGIVVDCGILEYDCIVLNAPFFKSITTGYPWVVAKYAMSLDGKIATRNFDSQWITGDTARQYTHSLRNRYDAILVGTDTLLYDNPRLTCRIDGGRDPMRVVLDAKLRVPITHNIFNAPENCILITSSQIPDHQINHYESHGIKCCPVGMDNDGRLLVHEIMSTLVQNDILSVMIEGGGTLLGAFFDAQAIDYVYGFIAPRLIGGKQAPSPVAGQGLASMQEVKALIHPSTEMLGDDVLIHGQTQWAAQILDQFYHGVNDICSPD